MYECTAPPIGRLDRVCRSPGCMSINGPLRWFGVSFYFIALDLGLPRDAKPQNRRGRGRVARSTGGSITSKSIWWAPRRCPDDLISGSNGKAIRLAFLGLWRWLTWSTNRAEFYLG